MRKIDFNAIKHHEDLKYEFFYMRYWFKKYGQSRYKRHLTAALSYQRRLKEMMSKYPEFSNN